MLVAGPDGLQLGHRDVLVGDVGRDDQADPELARCRGRFHQAARRQAGEAHLSGRQDAQALCGLLAGYITHPNVAGATVLSLGCQNAQVSMLEDEIKKRTPNFSKPMYILEQQKIGTEAAFLSEAIKQTFAGLILANQQTREPAPLSKICGEPT